MVFNLTEGKEDSLVGIYFFFWRMADQSVYETTCLWDKCCMNFLRIKPCPQMLDLFSAMELYDIICCIICFCELY
jgi:hypothetical protein